MGTSIAHQPLSKTAPRVAVAAEAAQSHILTLNIRSAAALGDAARERLSVTSQRIVPPLPRRLASHAT
jgi:hypothetical protein